MGLEDVQACQGRGGANKKEESTPSFPPICPEMCGDRRTPVSVNVHYM